MFSNNKIIYWFPRASKEYQYFFWPYHAPKLLCKTLLRQCRLKYSVNIKFSEFDNCFAFRKYTCNKRRKRMWCLQSTLKSFRKINGCVHVRMRAERWYAHTSTHTWQRLKIGENRWIRVKGVGKFFVSFLRFFCKFNIFQNKMF